MSTVKTLERLTVGEYLEAEKQADVRHEFVGGQVYAMVGASNVHNLIAGSLFALLRAHLKDPCHVYMSDMKVRVDEDFYYPDLLVSCASISEVAYYVTDPLMIVEVLSPTTEARDRVEKRIAYQKVSALQEYVLVSQERLQVEILRRVEQGWEVETCASGDRVGFRSISLEASMEEIYADVIKLLWKKA